MAQAGPSLLSTGNVLDFRTLPPPNPWPSLLGFNGGDADKDSDLFCLPGAQCPQDTRMHAQLPLPQLGGFIKWASMVISESLTEPSSHGSLCSKGLCAPPHLSPVETEVSSCTGLPSDDSYSRSAHREDSCEGAQVPETKGWRSFCSKRRQVSESIKCVETTAPRKY